MGEVEILKPIVRGGVRCGEEKIGEKNGKEIEWGRVTWSSVHIYE